jgi:hypothetical protein
VRQRKIREFIILEHDEDPDLTSATAAKSMPGYAIPKSIHESVEAESMSFCSL